MLDKDEQLTQLRIDILGSKHLFWDTAN